MPEKIIDLIAPPELIPGIVAIAREHGLEASSPMAVDSTSDALDAPLGVDELRQVLEVVTLIASTGTTVVGFLAAVKSLMKRSETRDGREPSARLVDTMTRRRIATLTADTNVDSVDL